MRNILADSNQTIEFYFDLLPQKSRLRGRMPLNNSQIISNSYLTTQPTYYNQKFFMNPHMHFYSKSLYLHPSHKYLIEEFDNYANKT